MNSFFVADPATRGLQQRNAFILNAIDNPESSIKALGRFFNMAPNIMHHPVYGNVLELASVIEEQGRTAHPVAEFIYQQVEKHGRDIPWFASDAALEDALPPSICVP